jgi:hypothetical protein
MAEGTRVGRRDPRKLRIEPHDVRHEGRVILAADPVDDMEAATARYVDAAAAAGGITAAAVSEAGDLVITVATGATLVAGHVVGPAGSAGPAGTAGAPGPAGPASVLGTPQGDWNADTNTPTLSDGSGTAGDAYVVSVAGTTSLDGIAAWEVGDVALRGASAWTRIPAASGSGAFTQVTLPKAALFSNLATGAGLDFADPYGEVILRLTGDQIIANGFSVGPDGPAFTAADMETATISELTAEDATVGGIGLSANGGEDGVTFADPYGEVLFSMSTQGLVAHGQTWRQDDGAPGHWFTDPYGEVYAGFTQTGDFLVAGLAMKAGTGGLIFADPYGEVFAAWDAAGLPSGFAEDGETGGSTTHSDAEIFARNGECLGAAAGMATSLDLGVARPVWKYNLVVAYGQSLAQGSEGSPTLSTAAKWGNLMVGDKTTSVSNSMPGANNATPPTWEVTGTAQFNPLVATNGVSNETVLHGALNTYRRMTLAWRGVQADADHLMIGAGAGVGGQDVASLQQGASPDLFNRVVSLMEQAHDIADTASGDFGVAAMLWLQGESDQTRTSEYYLPKLRDIYGDLKTYAIAETAQADPPAIFSYQTTAPNTNFDTAQLGVQMAQLTAALDDDGVFMIGPTYPVPDSNNLHLVANGYRWLGSQFGKVMFRVLTLGHRWKPLHMRRATLRGREVLVDFHVPHPPLVIDAPWMQTGWVVGSSTTGGSNSQFTQADAGFSVLTTAGAYQAIASVALVSETQILITLSDAPTSTSLWVRYADGLHKGHGSIRDSDPALADDTYLDGLPGQVAGETQPSLSGSRYPLWNWAVAQQIDVEA